MYKLIIDNAHKNIIKEAFISYFLIRQNIWREYLLDINSKDIDYIELLFKKAYETASPDYKNIFKIIEEHGKTVDALGFREDVGQIHEKVFQDSFVIENKSKLRTLLMVIEEFMRMRMGQFMDFVDDVAHNGWEYNQKDPDNDKKFDEYINRRDEAHKLFD